MRSILASGALTLIATWGLSSIGEWSDSSPLTCTHACLERKRGHGVPSCPVTLTLVARTRIRASCRSTTLCPTTQKKVGQRDSGQAQTLLHANGHWVFDRSYDFAPAIARIDSQCRFAQTPYLMRLNHTCCPLNASDSPLCRGDCESIQLGTVAPADAIRSATALRSWLLAKKPHMAMSSRLRDLGSDPK
jgi:hypothetical protein